LALRSHDNFAQRLNNYRPNFGESGPAFRSTKAGISWGSEKLLPCAARAHVM